MAPSRSYRSTTTFLWACGNCEAVHRAPRTALKPLTKEILELVEPAFCGKCGSQQTHVQNKTMKIESDDMIYEWLDN